LTFGDNLSIESETNRQTALLQYLL